MSKIYDIRLNFFRIVINIVYAMVLSALAIQWIDMDFFDVMLIIGIGLLALAVIKYTNNIGIQPLGSMPISENQSQSNLNNMGIDTQAKAAEQGMDLGRLNNTVEFKGKLFGLFLQRNAYDNAISGILVLAIGFFRYYAYFI